jgi:hypothetical protein
MNYRVDWTEEAEQKLAELWTSSNDRAGITAAARRIEQRLRLNPLTQGEARDDFDFRILFDGPLGAVYRIGMPGRVVVIVSVGPSRPA